MVVWTFLAVGYFWSINTFGLWPLLGFKGQPLTFPLAPLTVMPSLLFLLHTLTKWGLLFIVLLLQISTVEGWYKKQWFIITAICILILCWSVIISKRGALPEWFKTISILKRMPRRSNAYEAANELTVQMQRVIAERPEIKLFITSEGNFPFPLKEGRFTAMWQKNILDSNRTLILGAHKKQEGNLYNSMFIIDKCRIIQTYDKSSLVPFFEFSHFKNEKKITFLKGKHLSFSKSSKPTTPIYLNKNTSFLPVICIELYWQNRCKYQGIPIICIANDDFFSWASQILLFAAQIVALTEKRSIVYASSHHSYFIDEYGYLSFK